MWSAHGPRVRKRHTPHQGYEVEGREAMRKVEEYYHRLLENNGINTRLPPLKVQIPYGGHSEAREDLPMTGEGLASRRAWPFAAHQQRNARYAKASYTSFNLSVFVCRSATDRRALRCFELDPSRAPTLGEQFNLFRFNTSRCEAHIPRRQAKGSPSFRVNSPSPPILEHGSYLTAQLLWLSVPCPARRRVRALLWWPFAANAFSAEQNALAGLSPARHSAKTQPRLTGGCDPAFGSPRLHFGKLSLKPLLCCLEVEQDIPGPIGGALVHL
jgi:hypothetical protein